MSTIYSSSSPSSSSLLLFPLPSLPSMSQSIARWSVACVRGWARTYVPRSDATEVASSKVLPIFGKKFSQLYTVTDARSKVWLTLFQSQAPTPLSKLSPGGA